MESLTLRLAAPLALAVLAFAGCAETDTSSYPYGSGPYGTYGSYPTGQPVDQNGQPVYPSNQPVYSNGQPVYSNGQPVYQNGQPVYPNAPVYSNTQPTYSNGQPVYPGSYPQNQTVYSAPYPSAPVYSQPGTVYVPGPTGYAPDDYVYYPDMEVYYSPFRREYFYRDGNRWAERHEPPRYFNHRAPSVHVRVQGNIEHHHDEVRRQYPGHDRR